MARSKSSDKAAPNDGGGKAAPKGGSTASGVKLGKDGQPKVGRLKKLGNNGRMMKQAFTLTRRNDPKLPWVMLITFIVTFAVVELIGILLDSPFLFLPFAIILGLLATLIVFGRRAQGSAYRQVEGQPGAAAWALENMRGDWRVSAGVAGTPQLDAVHRVLGRPGVILVAEGSPQRVRGLIAQEKKKIARVVGDTPIYDVVVGEGEGQVPFKKLSSHVMKLPRNLSAAELNTLGRRMSALGGARMPVPGGPLPGGRQMSVSQRQVRRRG
ncbi:DUF4191 domain-containing protein [Blastococcus sp. LR1]|uniref:DUF4191 domain-containing protein n=1 Tax=Blastococcus sp. LR1 TaxID=2877000 RepID=UPI001CCBF232|nr:DUF4191 domain-containing protein [Blastococcus sp. LR1]MCA0143686.1 DUF4191 domain-containing protein [Blastococcus sp. LR1]